MECASVHEQQCCVCYLGNGLCCIAGRPVGDVGGRMFYLMPPNVGMCVL